MEVRTDLVALALSESVALSTSGLEEVGTLLCVAWKSVLAKAGVGGWFGSVAAVAKWEQGASEARSANSKA